MLHFQLHELETMIINRWG